MTRGGHAGTAANGGVPVGRVLIHLACFVTVVSRASPSRAGMVIYDRRSGTAWTVQLDASLRADYVECQGDPCRLRILPADEGFRWEAVRCPWNRLGSWLRP